MNESVHLKQKLYTKILTCLTYQDYYNIFFLNKFKTKYNNENLTDYNSAEQCIQIPLQLVFFLPNTQ